MKKRVLFIALGMLIAVFTTSNIYAQPFGFSGSFDFLTEGVWRNLQIILMFILGGDEIFTGELLFIKFLIFLLTLVILISALKKVPTIGENERVNRVIALLIALIAARYLTTEAMINLIWLPYGALGVLLSSLLPLIIYFFFIESLGSSFLRKVGWVAFGFIYLGLAYSRWSDFAIGGQWWQNLAMMYIGITIVSVIILIFERKINRMLIVSAIKKGDETQRILLRNDLQKDLDAINRALANPGLSSKEAGKLQDEKKRIQQAISRLN
ncbi:hypothetical protein COU56_03730 [Candidatus Pacearchaeota archaeon CG10_big_fil_rev_8_21_14_0_10_31_9]|nr:MAG: hypothetical protein AUJ62_03605 [Candidatus Pacearchaeota archaeon CG1_02_32_21]PIN93292.1 MAG: hypothetical protein COU56_03730 [Candidatus Pacearchaeota archaeon CG10_big_fil_rev_8_21_14_0_10_31_9]